METPIIRVYFGLEYSPGLFFTLDDPVRGVIDNTTYLIAGDEGAGVNIATDAFHVSIRRGRSRELDEFQAGVCTINLRNFDRAYDNLNAAGVYYGDLVPGKRVDVELYGQVLFSGTIEDWDCDWSVTGDATATITAVDAFGQLGLKEFDAWTTTAGQTADARLTSMLNRSEIAFGPNRDFGTGVSTLQADSVTWGSNALNYAQLVVKSEQGWLFASREGLLTFRGRHDLIGLTPGIEFRDDRTQVPFEAITTQTGSELLFNRVGVDREGGTLQTVEDATSEGAYGVRSLSLTGLLMDSDIQSLSMAEWLCHHYKDPSTRVASITVNLNHPRAAAFRATLAALDITDIVSVTWTPARVGAAVAQELVVEGVEHDINYMSGHRMSLSTVPSSLQGVFILDDPVWGVIDGPGLLSF